MEVNKSVSNEMSSKVKAKEKNRIRQLAFKVREKMPKDYKSFVSVANHLVKNAYRYHNIDELKKDENTEEIKLERPIQQEDEKSICKEVNKKLREASALNCQNQIIEQQELVSKLKIEHGSYRNLSKLAGVPLKTVHAWCSQPKERSHKSKERSELRRQEFTNFLMQDTITFSYPCKKYS